MNSLHTSTPQRTPIRGVALHPSGGTAADSTSSKASLDALNAMQKDVSLLQRSLRSVLKATRNAARGSALQVMVFVLALFAVVNAQAATYFRVGGGAWNTVAGWSSTSPLMGITPVMAVPGINDVAIFDTPVTVSLGGATIDVGRIVVQSGVTVTFSDAIASNLRVNGIAGDAINAPLIITPTSTMFVGSNISFVINNNLGTVGATARVFGTLAVGFTGVAGLPGAVNNNTVVGQFTIEDGGTLRMSGGTFTNGAGATITYAQTGARGTLLYDRPDNVAITIPLPGIANEVANQLGNLTLRRTQTGVATLTAGTYNLAGTLTVENIVSILTIPVGTTVNMAASRMISGGTISTTDNPAGVIELNYTELALATPLGAVTSDLAFTPPAMVTRLRNNIATLNLTVNSDMQIFGTMGGLEAGDVGAVAGVNQGGQITVAANRRMTLRNNALATLSPGGTQVGNISNFNTSRINVFGTLIFSTGATIANNNIATTGMNSGLVIRSGGILQFWGNTAQITGAGNTFYTDATAFADYQDARNTTVLADQLAARLANLQEIPATMNGSITVNRLGQVAADVSIVNINTPVTMNGNLNLISGGIGMNGNRMIMNGTITMAAGGYIAGSAVAGADASAFVYNNSAPTSVRTTSSTLTNFNHFGVTNTGNLTLLGSTVGINGMTLNAAYVTGSNNANGQLLLSNTGNLVLAASTLNFSGAGSMSAAAAQGGHIPATNVGSISGDTGSQIQITSSEARSYLRMTAGAQNLGTLYVLPAAAPTIATDYLLSLRTPLTVNTQLQLNNNAILHLGPGADLTLNNPAIGGGAPSPAGNFIDASQGGRLIVRNVGVANYTFPIGANRGAGTIAAAPAVAPSYLPATINNPLLGENYTVSVTTAIANVPAIPANLVSRSVGAQWTISKGMAAYNGPITLQWNATAGDEPVPFNTSLTTNSALTTIRRWTGTSYANVLPTTLPMFGPPRTLQATFNGNLAATTFIVSNALFPTYWVGGNNTDWGTATNWASSSAGAPGSASPPGVNDWPIFDQVYSPNISTNIPASVQRLTVINGANVTLSQNTTLNLAQSLAPALPGFFEESVHVGTSSTLTLGNPGGTGGTNVSIAPAIADVNARGIVFGTLRLNPGATFNHTVNAATARMIIASGATVNMAGGTFAKGAMTTLQYGSPDVPLAGSPINPYSPISTTLPPPILTYTENSALPVNTTPATTNEWGSAAPVAAFGASVVANRTGANRDFSIIGNVNLNGLNSVLSGRWILNPGNLLLVGTNPVSQNSTMNVSAGATLVGNNNAATELWLRGQGQSVLRFTSDTPAERQLGTMVIDNINAQVVLASSRNLSLIGMVGLNVVNANNDFGLVVSPADTLILADGVTSGLISPATNPGRILVAGRMTISQTAGAPHAAIAVNRPSGIMVGTTGTLELQSAGAGAITTTVALPDVPVAYLAPTSRLRYSGQGSVSNGVESTQRLGAGGSTFGFGGTLEIDKGIARGMTLPNINQNMITLGASMTVTGASVNIFNGVLDLSAAPGQRFTSYAPLVVPTTLGMFRTGIAANDARIEYNNPVAANLNFDASLGAPVFLSSLNVTNATMTMAAGTSATFQGVNALTDGIAGRLLLQGTANLNINGNTLSFTGDNTVGGYIASSLGVLTGSPTSALIFTSRRNSVVRMSNIGTGNQLANMTVNAVGAINNPYVILTSATVVNNTLTMNAAGADPLTGGGIIQLEDGVAFTVNTTNATMTPRINNNFIQTVGNSRLIMPIAAGARRLFPVGTTNTLLAASYYAPVMIQNTSGASDNYSVNASRTIINQAATFPQRVNVQWTVNKNGGSTIGDIIQFFWDASHEAAGYVRANGFVGRWNGSSYDNLQNASNGGPTNVAVPNLNWGNDGAYVSQYYSAFNILPITSYANTPFVILNPPSAIILAADSLSTAGSGGFNPATPNGFASPAAGNLTITSGTPFTLRFSAFNGLNQRSPVLAGLNIQAHLFSLPGQTAVFNTTGTGSLATPITLNVPANPISATTTNLTFDWLNPNGQASTTAILRLYDPTGTLTSANLTVTILAPPLRPSTIAMTQVQNSSNGTLGFNGGGLGQFNITGGALIPINFGFFSNSNFLAVTTSVTTVLASIAAHPANPGAVFSTTPGGVNGAINPATISVGANGGFIMPAFNVTGGPTFPGITRALLTLSAPGLGSTTVTVIIGTTGTATPFTPTRLAYSVNSGDILDATLSNQGINGGIFGVGTPIVSNQITRVNFASFANEGAVVRPNVPTQVQLSIAPDPINPGEVFTLEGTTATTFFGDGTGSLFPRIIYNANDPGQRAAILTLTAVSGQTTLITTTAQIWVSTTGTLATRTSFNPSVGPTTGHSSPAIGSAGINGGNLNIPSGRPFNIDFSYFNASDVLALGGATPMQLSIVGVTPGTETVTLDGTSSINVLPITRQTRMDNVILNWRNPTVAGPIQVEVQLTPVGLLSGFGANFGIWLPGIGGATRATITISTGSSVPVALAFSQISSSGTQGINNGNLNIVSGSPFNIDLGLFDANGVLAQSLSNSSVALTAQPVSGGQTFVVGGATGGVFVNQSGIRLNNVTVTWTNPSTPTTQVRLVVSTTAGQGPIAATSAVVTISAGAIFPTISAFTPGSGGPGTVVQISGSNFTGVNSVLFGGVPASFTVVGDNFITAVVPAGAVTGPITVSRPPSGSLPGGSGVSATPFGIGTPATITGFTPTFGGQGTLVTINGTNFGTSLAGIQSVNIAGVPGVVQSINTTGTQMIVQVAGSVTTVRTAPITIATATGVVTSSQLFTLSPPPTITSVTPNSAVVNGMDIPIIIRGSNFNVNVTPIPDMVQSGVYFSIFNTPQAISPSLRLSIQSASSTEIRALISGTFNNMVGQRFVTVLNNDGQYTSVPFQLVQGQSPTLTAISPSVTSASGSSFVATITGTGFFGVAGVRISANDTPLNVLSVTPTQIQVIIPSDLNRTPQVLNVVVSNSDGQQVRGTITITDPGRPVINSITPPRAIIGSPETIITINGSGFFLDAVVSFNNIPLQVLNTPVQRSTTQIVAVIPASLLANFGTFPIRVTNPGGFSGASVFSVGFAPPVVTSVVTASGANAGQNVTAASVFPFQLAINGSGFRAGVGVTFNGTNLQIISTSNTQVIAQVPATLNMTGVWPVSLVNPDGLSSTATFVIGQPNAPVITAISPSVTNATATPFVITITGRNFGVSPQGQPLAGFQVRFNGLPLQILSASPTTITAAVPAGINSQEGPAAVQVINPDTQQATRTIDVLCTVCPIIVSSSPTSLRSQYPFDVTFTVVGSNFQQGATVTVGGVPLRIVSVEQNRIVAVAPAGFFLGDPTIRILNPDGRAFTFNNGFTVSVREVMTVEVMSGSVFPNPVEDMVSFEANMPKAGQLRVRITDVLGKTMVLFTQAVGAGKFTNQLDVSALPTGVYIFEMTDGERRFTEKLIKR